MTRSNSARPCSRTLAQQRPLRSVLTAARSVRSFRLAKGDIDFVIAGRNQAAAVRPAPAPVAARARARRRS
jgi:hypothetical protein